MANHPNRSSNPIVRTALMSALGYDLYRAAYKARLALGYEFCKRWLVENKAYHGLDLDDALQADLRKLCDGAAKHN